MDIWTVEAPLVCTRRIAGLQQASLKVLRNSANGSIQVAVDPVGAREGNYVFTLSGSAARWAIGFDVLTDLTIGGIIDLWDVDESLRPGSA